MHCKKHDSRSVFRLHRIHSYISRESKTFRWRSPTSCPLKNQRPFVDDRSSVVSSITTDAGGSGVGSRAVRTLGSRAVAREGSRMGDSGVGGSSGGGGGGGNDLVLKDEGANDGVR